jgi:hypothetical protein
MQIFCLWLSELWRRKLMEKILNKLKNKNERKTQRVKLMLLMLDVVIVSGAWSCCGNLYCSLVVMQGMCAHFLHQFRCEGLPC